MGLGVRALRCLAVWMTTTAGLALPARRLISEAARGAGTLHPPASDGPAVEDALAGLAALALLGCLAWAWAAATAVVLEALAATGALARPCPGVPALLRRVVLAACGVALTGTSLHPAYAEPGAQGDRRPPVVARIVGLPLPELVPTVPPHRSPGRSVTPWVVVAPGDSLWSVAERDLPPGSSPAAVAARWHAIYDANRARIGPDPDLISPGTRLHLPGKESS